MKNKNGKKKKSCILLEFYFFPFTALQKTLQIPSTF